MKVKEKRVYLKLRGYMGLKSVWGGMQTNQAMQCLQGYIKGLFLHSKWCGRSLKGFMLRYTTVRFTFQTAHSCSFGENASN